ncbi:Heterokaryon incompatibility [Fusarium albosuccineum]|uniref:Heterokaryon incompatibility n=1 Tax=Fusarium albosuccineum TaxID=1237068 RepID=A0A8H4LGW6_9HYPO|nr:Heterokaryon incompatibility [Fusarium albosuccineum]
MLPLTAFLWKETEKPAELCCYVSGRSLANFNVRIFAHEGTPAADHITGRPIRSHDQSASIIAQFKSWADDCKDNHAECRNGICGSELLAEPLLPTRVLDVGSSKHHETEPIRLIISEGKRAAYVALSHCWGGKDHHPITTTRATLQGRLEQIKISALSKTFREAVAVTRGLGIRYLWIDTLCIIQNDEGLEDWAQEADKMGAYYEQAFCVLSATAAPNGDIGLFTNHPPVQAVRMDCDPGKESSGHYYIASPDPDRFKEVELSPLNRRGWVFQEYVLGRRRIHCALGQVYWECSHHFAAEDGTSQNPATWTIGLRLALSDNREGFLRFHAWWRASIGRYSSCGLTYGSDKLPALLGVANRIMETAPSLRFVSGHWRDRERGMEQSLLWHPTEGRFLQRPRDQGGLEIQRAPSWSWASLDGPVEFATSWNEKDDAVLDLAITDINESTTSGLPACCPLTVTGVLKKACRSANYTSHYDGFLFAEQRSFDVVEPSGAMAGTVLFDCHDDQPFDFLCAPVTSVGSRGRLSLALTSVDSNGSDQVYRRIGVVKIKDDSWFAGREPLSFFIV